MSAREPEYVWMNGEFVKHGEARVSVLTHALHYGTGVFEGIRAYQGEDNIYVFRLKEHMKRLHNSAKILHFSIKYAEEELCDATTELLRRNGLRGPAYIRPIAFVGVRPGGIELGYSGFPIQVAIIAFPFEAYFEKAELKVCVSQWRRISETSLPPQAKACGIYLNSALAKYEAKLNGYDEAILLDQNGSVCEGTGENIFLVRDGRLVTPPISSPIVEGITRDSVINITRDLELEFAERSVARAELYSCSELFFTGTAAGVLPIVEVDRRQVGDGKPGRVTMLVRDEYNKIVQGKTEKYRHWLTPVY